MARGTIAVLSANKGDDKLELPDDRAEAKKKVDELLGKKYSIMVTVKTTTGEGDSAKTSEDTHKVSGYDEATGEYIVKQGEKELRFSTADTTAVAIAPTAGG